VNIVAISGSPSEHSRSAGLLRHVLSRLAPGTQPVGQIALRALPPAALLGAQADDPAIRAAREQVAAARFVVIATPIYKAAYSGLLKAFLDLLPQDGLRDKTVLPLATGGSIAHLLALDYALKPVLSALGARDILDPVFATDPQIPKHDVQGYQPSADVQERVRRSLQTLIDRSEEFQRQEDAARERDALLQRARSGEDRMLEPAPAPTPSPWPTGNVRWSV